MAKASAKAFIKLSASICPVAKVPFSYCGRLHRVIPVLSSMGYKGVEPLLSRPDDLDVPSLERLLSKYEMEVPAIGTGLAATEGLSLSAQDEKIRIKAVGRILAFSKLAERFDSWVVLGSVRGGLSQPSRLTSLEKSAKELAQTKSLIEPLNRYEGSYINTASEAVLFIEKNDLKRFGILLDAFHMNIEEKSPAGAIRTAGGKLAHFHIADSNREVPGEGHIDFNSISKALKEVGYVGYLSAEILHKSDPVSALRRTHEFVIDLMRKTSEHGA